MPLNIMKLHIELDFYKHFCDRKTKLHAVVLGKYMYQC